MSIETDVQEMYIGLLGRAADKAGYDYWVEQLTKETDPLTIEDVRANIVNEQEEYAEGIGSMTRSQGVTQLYLNLFGREPEPEGLDYWVNGEGAGVNFDQLVLALIDGASPTDRLVLDNRDEVAIAYTDSDYGSADPFDIDSAASIIQGVDSTRESVDEALDAIDNGEISSGETFVLTTGLDVIDGTTGNDTILGLYEDTTRTDTFTLGDSINGGAGDDLLSVSVDDDELLLTGKTISNVEMLEALVAYQYFDELNVNNNDFEQVNVNYAGTDHDSSVYINNINGTTDLVIENVSMDGHDSFYRNNDEDADATEGSVAVSNTLQGWDDAGAYSYYYGYNVFSMATEINHTFNVLDNYVGDEGMYVYDYIESGVAGSVINSTVNISDVTNEEGDEEYSYVYVYGENTSVGGMSTYNFMVNIADSDDIYTYFEAGDSGDSDTIVYNVSNHTNEDNNSELWSDSVETVTVNVTGDSEFEYLGNGSNQDNAQSVTINADADLTIADYVGFESSVGDVTLTLTGSGNVDLGATWLGDGDAADSVMVDASAMTGDFTIAEIKGNASSITSGSGEDDVTVNSDETAVSTGDGDDSVDTNGHHFGASKDSAMLDGGAGNDTIAINNGANLDAAAAANIENFEVLDVTAGTGTYDMDVETSLKDVVASGLIVAPVTIDNAASDVALTFQVFDSINALTMNQKDGSGKADELAITLIANDDNKDQTADGQTSAVLVAAEYETINLVSVAQTKSEDSAPGADDKLEPADYVNTIDLKTADTQSITVAGIAQAKLVFTDAAALTFIDASNNAAGVTADASAGGIVGGLTFKGGAGADTYTATANGDLIQGNGAADVVTLGAADDTVRFVAASDSQLLLLDKSTPPDDKADLALMFDSITDFNTAGTDLIELSSELGLATGDARADILQKGNMGGNTPLDIQTFIGDGVDFFDTGVVDRATAFSDGGGHGYLWIDVNSDGDFTQADDMFIELAGQTTFDITDITFG